MNLSVDQITALAAAAGFAGPDLVTAVAIALAESGGNPQAYNPEVSAGAAAGQGSYGLWQIYLAAHPQYSAASLIQPDYNAAAAFQLYQQAGDSFQQWTTYRSGAYQAYVPSAEASAAAAGLDGSSDGSSTVSYLPMLLVGAELLVLFLLRG